MAATGLSKNRSYLRIKTTTIVCQVGAVLTFGSTKVRETDTRQSPLSNECLQRWCKKPSKKTQNVCVDGCIKHGSEFSCVWDEGHTIQFNELFPMRRNKRNGQPDEGVCDIQHTVHSDELFVIRQHKRNG